MRKIGILLIVLNLIFMCGCSANKETLNSVSDNSSEIISESELETDEMTSNDENVKIEYYEIDFSKVEEGKTYVIDDKKLKECQIYKTFPKEMEEAITKILLYDKIFTYVYHEGIYGDVALYFKYNNLEHNETLNSAFSGFIGSYKTDFVNVLSKYKTTEEEEGHVGDTITFGYIQLGSYGNFMQDEIDEISQKINDSLQETIDRYSEYLDYINSFNVEYKDVVVLKEAVTKIIEETEKFRLNNNVVFKFKEGEVKNIDVESEKDSISSYNNLNKGEMYLAEDYIQCIYNQLTIMSEFYVNSIYEFIDLYNDKYRWTYPDLASYILHYSREEHSSNWSRFIEDEYESRYISYNKGYKDALFYCEEKDCYFIMSDEDIEYSMNRIKNRYGVDVKYIGNYHIIEYMIKDKPYVLYPVVDDFVFE